MFEIQHLFSLIASIFITISTFSKRKNKMFVLQAGTSVFNGIANGIVGSPTGIVTNIISLIRNILVAKDKWSKWTASICAILCFSIGLISNQKGIIGILPVLSTTSYCIVLLFCKNAQHVRYILVYTNIIWAIYNFTVGLYIAGIMSCTLVLFSTINIIRYWIEQKNASLTKKEEQ